MKLKNLNCFLIAILVVQFFGYSMLPLVLGGEVRIVKSQFISEQVSDFRPVFQKGISYSAWASDDFSSSESDESLAQLTQINTKWISICFSWVQSNSTSYDIHPDPERTATTDSVQHAIAIAHSLGLKVMLKPMVDTLEEEQIQGYPTVWRGEIQPSNAWFENYSNFINFFAELAEQNNVELFCIGCEFKKTTDEKEQWEKVVRGVREIYSGAITYASDWTNYKNIEWWNAVDYVGIDAYFPLTLFNKDPTLEQLKNAWTNYADEIEEWLSTVNKPVIFTEIGYRSGDGTCMTPSNYWTNMTVDLEEQSDCYEATFQVLWNRNWFYGLYWWTWTPDPEKGGPNDSSHIPQNKPVQEIITTWYSMDKKIAVIDKSFTSAEKCYINENQTVGFHASWTSDKKDVVEAKVFVNGTEYITNRTGWIVFSISYDDVGKRCWVISNFQHSESNGYTIIADNPSIIWDQIFVDVKVDSSLFGITKVQTIFVQAYDDVPIEDAITAVNGKICEEEEPGIYKTQITSWYPYQQLTITTDIEGLEGKTWTTATVHIINSILYLAVVLTVIVMAVLLFKRQRKHKQILNRRTDNN